jgi:Asp-tRNA(Asn)/Glu-tRNA(Gln) amidotransferase A subunit family amidase
MAPDTNGARIALQPGLHGAFMREGFGTAPTGAWRGGPLQGLRLAVKDVFDVQGQRSGCGNPEWLAASPPARDTATAVRLLLAAGAGWIGRTVTDELTYSLAGVNAHYGTPANPAAPDRIPGGSSSGSAAAVAGGHADIGLGTDCGGSIRLPASYCGLWGLRPTHGRIAGTGCLTLAHSFDTVGWFARDAQVLIRVFETLAHTCVRAAPPPRLVIADDIPRLLVDAVGQRFAALPQALEQAIPLSRLPAGHLAPVEWAQALRVLQAAEAWQQHGDWFGRHGASLGADIRARFEQAARVTAADVATMQRLRVRATEVLAHVLEAPGALLLLPTVPGPAPRLAESPEGLLDIRARSQQLLCMAGLAGLPQVSMPWVTVDGAPVGLSLIGKRGDDATVLAGAVSVRAMLDATEAR